VHIRDVSALADGRAKLFPSFVQTEVRTSGDGFAPRFDVGTDGEGPPLTGVVT